jgi:hypothetical protein
MIGWTVRAVRRLVGWAVMLAGVGLALIGLLGAVSAPLLPQAPLTIAQNLPGGNVLPGLVLWGIVVLLGVLLWLAGRMVAGRRNAFTATPEGPNIGADPR